MVTPGMDASVRGSFGQGARGNTISRMMAPIQDNIEGMRELADPTGGRAAYNTNDLARAVRRAIDDARVTYTLGYYSTDEAQDGKFREIKVKVTGPVSMFVTAKATSHSSRPSTPPRPGRTRSGPPCGARSRPPPSR